MVAEPVEALFQRAFDRVLGPVADFLLAPGDIQESAGPMARTATRRQLDCGAGNEFLHHLDKFTVLHRRFTADIENLLRQFFGRLAELDRPGAVLDVKSAGVVLLMRRAAAGAGIIRRRSFRSGIDDPARGRGEAMIKRPSPARLLLHGAGGKYFIELEQARRQTLLD